MGDILIVEDTPSDLRFLSEILVNAGYRTRPACDGELALRSARARPPDLVLLDLHLPGISGIEVCRRLKAEPATRDVPVIFTSAERVVDRKVEALQAGAIDYIAKPIDAAEVLARIETHLQVSRLQQQLARQSAALRAEVEERKRSEALLRESEERLQALFQAASDTFVLLDLEHRVLLANRHVAGRPSEEAVGTPLYELAPPEDREQVRGLLDRVVQDAERQQWDTVYARPDGGDISLICVAAPVVVAGAVTGSAVNVRDVSDWVRLQRERDQLADQRRESQKLEAVGQLAGGVAHDFNNILQAMMTDVAFAWDERSSEAERREDQESLRAGITRAADLTRQLLAFSRRQVLEPAPQDPNELIEGLLRMVRRLIGEDIGLDYQPDAEVGSVHADAGQIEQVLVNLCLNARDAMPDGGDLQIRTASVSIDAVVDAAFVAAHPGVQPGPFVQIRVTDSGVGMDPGTLAQIFDPFFTTKPKHKGTGLGLSTAYGIIKQHQGLITAESEPGVGTTITIYLPRTDDAGAGVTEAPVAAEAGGGGETILIAEDDPSVRRSVRRVLEKAGYTVILAEDGAQAVRLYEDRPAAIDLALLDVVMPGMGGREANDRIRAVDPQAKILFSSGYSEDAIHTRFVLDPDMHLLRKPYAPAELRRRVRERLDLGR